MRHFRPHRSRISSSVSVSRAWRSRRQLSTQAFGLRWPNLFSASSSPRRLSARMTSGSRAAGFEDLHRKFRESVTPWLPMRVPGRVVSPVAAPGASTCGVLRGRGGLDISDEKPEPRRVDDLPGLADSDVVDGHAEVLGVQPLFRCGRPGDSRRGGRRRGWEPAHPRRVDDLRGPSDVVVVVVVVSRGRPGPVKASPWAGRGQSPRSGRNAVEEGRAAALDWPCSARHRPARYDQEARNRQGR